jgi:Kef-type K+ transport system membrane component KefB
VDTTLSSISPIRQRSAALGLGLYTLLLIQAVAGVLIVRWYGENNLGSPTETLTTEPFAATAAPQALAAAVRVDIELHVLITLAAVIGLGHLLGRVFRRFGQPPVIAEVVAGICLGPSVLGTIHSDAMHLLIPSSSVDPQGTVSAALKMIGELGVLLYMFVVGLDLNMTKLKARAGAAVAISHASIVVPFLLGVTLALWLHPIYAPAGIGFTGFALFLGVAMSITAFPVLARILTDRNLETTPLGMMAMACAAVDDATAWCLLAIVVGIVRTQSGSAITVCLGAIAYILAMFIVVRPLLVTWCRKLDDRVGPLSTAVLAAGCVGALISGLITKTIGIHAIFGAFLLGAVIPSDSSVAKFLKTRLRDSVTVLLLPAFFAYSGMRTEIGLVSGWQQWAALAAIIAVATVGKFGGTLMAARWTGIGWRDSASLGVLMNTRGLMELIVLNIGLDLGVISQTMFALMVLMALVTTMATSPVLARLMPESLLQEPRDVVPAASCIT